MSEELDKYNLTLLSLDKYKKYKVWIDNISIDIPKKYITSKRVLFRDSKTRKQFKKQIEAEGKPRCINCHSFHQDCCNCYLYDTENKEYLRVCHNCIDNMFLCSETKENKIDYTSITTCLNTTCICALIVIVIYTVVMLFWGCILCKVL